MASFKNKLDVLDTLGPLYEFCGMSGIWEDSKTIVYVYCPHCMLLKVSSLMGGHKFCRDMPLRDSPERIMRDFEDTFGAVEKSYQYERADLVDGEDIGHVLNVERYGNMDDEVRDKLHQFVAKWFLPAGSDTTHVKMMEGSSEGECQNMHDDNSEEIGQQLTLRSLLDSMSKLCRKAIQPAQSKAECSSLIHAPYPFVIPGERFRESYYWDSFWIMEGLLKYTSCYDFCLGIVRNFAYMVESIGMVPNGFRSYYLNRSQPPMLTCMVWTLCKHAKSRIDVITEFLPVMTKEILFWRESERTLHFDSEDQISVSRYYSNWTRPRPESLKEDLATFESLKAHVDWDGLSRTERQILRDNLFRNISAAAESGWDFSSRWLDGSNTLKTIRTTRIIPVDLNALLMKSERLVSCMAKEIGDEMVHYKFDQYYRERRQSFPKVFWDSKKCKWRDALLNKDCSAIVGFSREEDYASDWVPLWCLDDDMESCIQAIESLKNSKVNATGGIAASSTFTGQQWDWPNVWPPLQYFLGEGCWSVSKAIESHLLSTGVDLRKKKDIEAIASKAKILGDSIKERYLLSAQCVWAQKGTLPEKFDCEHPGGFGYGGEYECVQGFGWTTGLALHWLS